MDKFELRLIPEFDGLSKGPFVVKWFEKVEWVCKLFKVKDPSMMIPLGLTKGASVVYQQLGEDADLDEVKCALYMAFGTDPFIAWKQLAGQRIEPGETVDVYLADLRRLAVPFGGATDCILERAFMVRLPDNISLLLRAFLRLDKLEIDKLLAMACNILKDTELVAAAARTTETPSERQHAAGDSKATRKPKMLQMWWS